MFWAVAGAMSSAQLGGEGQGDYVEEGGGRETPAVELATAASRAPGAPSVRPGPRQQPHQPTYALGTSGEDGEFAARNRVDLGVAYGPFEVIGKATEYYRDQFKSYGWEPTAETALAILQFSRERLAPYKRVRRVEFTALPKTISGKIRRVDLRAREQQMYEEGASRATTEFREEDFPSLKR